MILITHVVIWFTFIVIWFTFIVIWFTFIVVSTMSSVSSSPMSSLVRTPPVPSEELEELVKVEGTFSTEVGQIVLNMMEVFADKFRVSGVHVYMYVCVV